MLRFKSWNPIIGCKKFSSGCKNCYAFRFAKRLKDKGNKYYSDGFGFKFLTSRLNRPFFERKRVIFFVNSMSDLFYEKVDFGYIDKIFEVIRNTDHIYLVLTKRAERMKEYFKDSILPSNVIVGVTVEEQKYCFRIEILKSIKAKIKLVSFEPLIGQINRLNLRGIDWVVVGGETGYNARPMRLEWVKYIFDQCRKYNVSFYFKQFGSYLDSKIDTNLLKSNHIYFSLKEYPKKMIDLITHPTCSLFERMEITDF